VLLGAFGLVIPGPAYVASRFFERPAAAQMVVRLGFSALTIVLYFTSFAMEYPTLAGSLPGLARGATAVRYIGLLFPPYALAKGIADIGILSGCDDDAEAAGIPTACQGGTAFHWNVAGANIAFLLAALPLWYGTVVSLDSVACRQHRLCRRRAGSARRQQGGGGGDSGVNEPDADVAAEAAAVDAAPASEAGVGVMAAHLRKVYPLSARAARARARAGVQSADSDASGGMVAVADVSLRLHEGECFALLGPNGAGKSTTLDMLVGETVSSGGTIQVCGMDIATARAQPLALIGYCPQVDALFKWLTGAEVLTFYAALGGVPVADLPALVDAALTALDLHRHRDMYTARYSGGTKRRLALAVAYIMAPRVVFLDEPSTGTLLGGGGGGGPRPPHKSVPHPTALLPAPHPPPHPPPPPTPGVDPVARRRMFDVIRAARAGRTTLLTTHVMEDADALSSRVGILVNGRLACLGSAPHLKRKYGRGYRVEVRVRGGGGGSSESGESEEAACRALVAGAASGVTLLESDYGHYVYEAQAPRLPALFRALEAARASAGVVDYAITQTTLELVFLRLCAQQRRSEGGESGDGDGGGGRQRRGGRRR